MSSRDVAEAVVDESIEVGLMRPMPLPEGWRWSSCCASRWWR
jgi:hypothetical protein